MKLKLATSSIILALASQTSLAEETSNLEWEASSELGYVMTDGNSDTETLNAKFNASTSYENWKHSLKLETLNSSSNDVRSSEKYLAQGQSDYALSENSYALGVITWEKDRYGAYDHQTSVALGAGYTAIKSKTMNLNFELAPGYRSIVDHNGNNEEDLIVRFAENFDWKLSETATLEQNLSTESGDTNTITRFGLGLASQIAGDLSMKLGYNVKHNSDVPAGTRSVDRETAITLVYKH